VLHESTVGEKPGDGGKMGVKTFVLAFAMLACVSSIRAQFYGYKQRDKMENKASILRPPTGAKVAVIECEDLQCPPCAEAYPIVSRTIAQSHGRLIRYD
jgi:protein-disulfide isomerase